MKWIVRLTPAGVALVMAAILAAGVWAWVHIIRLVLAGAL